MASSITGTAVGVTPSAGGVATWPPSERLDRHEAESPHDCEGSAIPSCNQVIELDLETVGNIVRGTGFHLLGYEAFAEYNGELDPRLVPLATRAFLRSGLID